MGECECLCDSEWVCGKYVSVCYSECAWECECVGVGESVRVGVCGVSVGCGCECVRACVYTRVHTCVCSMAWLPEQVLVCWHLCQISKQRHPAEKADVLEWGWGWGSSEKDRGPGALREGPFCFQPGSGFSQTAQPGPLGLTRRLSSPVFLVAVAGVCGCCGALRPRYKRLVDNIFPEDPEVGLVSCRQHASHHLTPSRALGAAPREGRPRGSLRHTKTSATAPSVTRGSWEPEERGALGRSAGSIRRGLWKCVSGAQCFWPLLSILSTHVSLGDSSLSR